MKRTAFLLLAAVSLLAVAVWPVAASTRPRYGGTLRMQLKEMIVSFDPSDGRDLTPTRNRIADLVFDRLTKIDAEGRLQPRLALTWSSDLQSRVWTFQLRRGVKFHDGSELTVATVVSSLNNNPKLRAKPGTAPNTVTVECDTPMRELPVILAGVRYSIVLHNADGNASGTGPFQVSEFQPSRRLLLVANQDYFEGRPYLDGIEMQFGNFLREQLVDLRLDRDDVIEIGLDQVRRLTQANQKISSASQSDLYALSFVKAIRGTGADGATATSKSITDDIRIRELLARSIDGDAIYNVILQKQGAPAHSLLPQWLTGYSFLLAPPPDSERVNKLRTDVGKVPPLFLAYDSIDPIARSIADRISVNARDVGIVVQAYGEKNLSITSTGQTSRADVVLVRIATGSTNVTQSLMQYSDSARLNPAPLLSATTPEERLAAESAMLNEYKLVPIVHVAANFWLGSRVRDWELDPAGGWRLEQVWLDSEPGLGRDR